MEGEANDRRHHAIRGKDLWVTNTFVDTLKRNCMVTSSFHIYQCRNAERLALPRKLMSDIESWEERAQRTNAVQELLRA